MAAAQRQLFGGALILAGLYYLSQPRGRTQVIEAPPRGIAAELDRLLDTLESQIAAALAQLNEVEAAINQALAALQQAHEDLSALRGQIADLEATLTDTLELVDGAIADAEAVDAILQDMADGLEDLVGLVDGQARAIVLELQAQLQQALARIAELEAALEDIRRRVEQALGLLDNLRAQVDDLVVDVEAMTQALEELAADAQGLREILAAVLDTIKQFRYYLEEVTVTLSVSRGQQKPFHTHVAQTATIQYSLDVWPSLFHCASAWVDVLVGGQAVFTRYNRSCCSCCACWEACHQVNCRTATREVYRCHGSGEERECGYEQESYTECDDDPNCRKATRGEAVGGTEYFTLPAGIGALRAYGGDDQSDRAAASATLTFRTIRLFLQ